MPKDNDLIDYAIHRDGDRYEIGLRNLTKNEAAEVLIMLANMQDTRARTVLAPTEWAALTDTEQEKTFPVPTTPLEIDWGGQ